MNAQTPLPAPGWYADPASPETALRYWDGATWTEHTHPVATAEPEQTVAPTDPDQPGSTASDAERSAADPAADAGQATAEPTPSAPDTAVPSAGPETGSPDLVAAAADPTDRAADASDPQQVPSSVSATEQGPSPSAADPAHTAPQAPQPNPYAAAPRPDPYAAAAQPDPYAAAAQPNPYAAPAQPNPYGAAPHPNPYGTAPHSNPYVAAPQQPAAPWAQGPGNPYQSPQVPRYGAPAGAPKSRAGLWIGLGIGGGVLLLLLIGIIVAVSSFLSAVNSGLAGPQDPDPFAGEVPSTTAPEIAGDPLAIGDPVNYTSEYSPEITWELVLTEYLGDITDEADSLYGGEIVAATAQITNTGTQPSDPYYDLDAVFLAADGAAYDDHWYVEPALIDLDTIEPGETVEFTFSFEVPAGAADGGSIVITDYSVENGVEVRLD